MMDIATASHVSLIHLHTHRMLNLDYYDTQQWIETYCEDTLFAFGSEDFQQPGRGVDSAVEPVPALLEEEGGSSRCGGRCGNGNAAADD